MRKSLIYLNLFVINFLFWYFIIRITGDNSLNKLLDTLIAFAINDIQMVVIFVLGVFMPLDKAKEIIKRIKK